MTQRYLRYFLPLVLAIAAPIAILAAWTDQWTQTEARRELQETCGGLAASLATMIDAELIAQRQALAQLAASPSLDARDLRAFADEARAVLKIRRGWLRLVASDGARPLFDSAEGRLPALPAETVAALADPAPDPRPDVGGLEPACLASPGPCFVVNLPVTRAGGGANCVLAAAVSPAAIEQLLERAHLPENYGIVIADAAGQPVAASPRHLLKASLPLTDDTTQLQSLALGAGEATLLGMVNTVESSRWRVVVGEYAQDFDDELAQRRRRLALAVALAMLFSAAAGTLLARSYGRHLAARDRLRLREATATKRASLEDQAYAREAEAAALRAKEAALQAQAQAEHLAALRARFLATAT